VPSASFCRFFSRRGCQIAISSPNSSGADSETHLTTVSRSRGSIKQKRPACSMRSGTFPYHQRLEDLCRGGDLRGQRPLQPGEPPGPIRRWGAGLVGSGRQSAEQLGVRGHDGPGVESQGVVGIVSARAAPAGGNGTRPGSSRPCGWNSARFLTPSSESRARSFAQGDDWCIASCITMCVCLCSPSSARPRAANGADFEAGGTSGGSPRFARDDVRGRGPERRDRVEAW